MGLKLLILDNYTFNFSNSTVGYSVIGYNVVEDVLNQLIDEGQIANIM